MGGFAYNILAGILATLILSAIIYFLSRPIKKMIFYLKTFYEIKNILGIQRVFSTRKHSKKILSDTLHNTKCFKMISFKGYSLLDSNNRIETMMYEIIKSDQNRIQQIQLLLMNPNGEENIKRRIKEIVRKVDKEVKQHLFCKFPATIIQSPC